MASNVKFFRGSRAKYAENLEAAGALKGEAIYFATDTQEIVVNDKSYGGGITNFEVKEKEGAAVIYLKLSNGTAFEIPVADLFPEQIAEMVNGLSASLVAASEYLTPSLDDVVPQVATHLFDEELGEWRKAEEGELDTHYEKKNFLVHEEEENKLAVREIDANATKLQKDIVVAGLSSQLGAGGYENEDVIPAGTDIYTILQNLLCKELYPDYDSSKQNVSASASYTMDYPDVVLENDLKNESIVEVGTRVLIKSATTNTTVLSTSVDSAVTGLTYGYSQANDNSKDSTNDIVKSDINRNLEDNNYTISVTITNGFSQGTTPAPVDRTNTALVQAKLEGIDLGMVSDGSNKFDVTAEGALYSYSAAKVPAVYYCSNLGNTNEDKVTVEIPAVAKTDCDRPTKTKTITITGRYYYYVSFIPSESNAATDLITEDNIKDSSNLIKKEFISSTTKQDLTFSNGGFHVIACPPSTSLTQVQNSFGFGDMLPNFKPGKTINMEIGGNLTAEYKVYYTHSAGDGTVLYRNVKITK